MERTQKSTLVSSVVMWWREFFLKQILLERICLDCGLQWCSLVIVRTAFHHTLSSWWKETCYGLNFIHPNTAFESMSHSVSFNSKWLADSFRPRRKKPSAVVSQILLLIQCREADGRKNKRPSFMLCSIFADTIGPLESNIVSGATIVFDGE